MMEDIGYAVDIAFATMKTKNMGIKKATEAVSKSLKLNAEQSSVLERCLIERALGIGDPNKEWQRKPSQWLELYKQAVLAKDECDLGGLGVCSAREAEAVLGGYIAMHL